MSIMKYESGPFDIVILLRLAALIAMAERRWNEH